MLLELVTLGLADTKTPWSFFLHQSKLHDPRLLLHIVAFKGFGLSEWVDLTIANGRCEPVSEAVCDEIDSLVWNLDLRPFDKHFMQNQLTGLLRSHIERTVEHEMTEKQPRKRDHLGRFMHQYRPSLYLVMWSRVKYHVLASLLLRSLRLWPECKRTIGRMSADLYYDWEYSSIDERESDSTDPEYLNIWNDIAQQWTRQYSRIVHQLKSKRKAK